MAQTLQGHGFAGMGLDDAQPDVIRVMKLGGTVTAGMVVQWVAVTDHTAEGTIVVADASDALPLKIAGVALDGGVSGGYIRVCRMGPCLVNCGDASITAFQAAGLHATTDGAADNADATENSFGVFLSAHDVGGTDKAVVDVHLVARAPDA